MKMGIQLLMQQQHGWISQTSPWLKGAHHRRAPTSYVYMQFKEKLTCSNKPEGWGDWVRRQMKQDWPIMCCSLLKLGGRYMECTLLLCMFENFQGKKLKVRFYGPIHFVACNTVITNTVRWALSLKCGRYVNYYLPFPLPDHHLARMSNVHSAEEVIAFWGGTDGIKTAMIWALCLLYTAFRPQVTDAKG